MLHHVYQKQDSNKNYDIFCDVINLKVSCGYAIAFNAYRPILRCKMDIGTKVCFRTIFFKKSIISIVRTTCIYNQKKALVEVSDISKWS